MNKTKKQKRREYGTQNIDSIRAYRRKYYKKKRVQILEQRAAKRAAENTKHQKDNIQARSYVNKINGQINLIIVKKALKPEMKSLLLNNKRFELRVVAAE